ncbi:MAG: hypothetical protein JW798_01940 [Prolixibacteraceae bacterium]|nr:hypothetical protein [Prolixibacteraceae bacterium]
MEKITFLGKGNNALSMFVEIALVRYNREIEIIVVKNQVVESDIPYLPEGIIACERMFGEYDFPKLKQYVIGVNLPAAKRKVYEFFLTNGSVNFEFYRKLISPDSSIASSAKLEDGIVINPGVVIAPFSALGNLVTINRNVSVGHHTAIDDFTTLHPGANIAGHCKIGKGATIGMGATVIDGVSVGDNSVIGAGSLVTKDIPANVVAYGFPAKIIRTIIA